MYEVIQYFYLSFFSSATANKYPPITTPIQTKIVANAGPPKWLAGVLYADPAVKYVVFAIAIPKLIIGPKIAPHPNALKKDFLKH